MAITTIGGADLSLLRGFQSIPDAAFFITPLDSVVSGTITAISNRYPTTQLTMSWGGATTGVIVGQLVKITNGATIRAYGVVRKDVSGNTLYISETPLGAYGYATMIESPILVGDTVTIYNHRPLWGLYSRIDAASKLFYKQWDVAYTNQNEGDIVLANAGAWQAARLAVGETTYRFTLPLSGANSSINLAGGSPDIEWTLPSGVTLVAGYALDDEVIEVDAVAGSHLVSMYAEVGGKNHTAYLWLFVSDGTNALSDAYAVTVPESDSQSRLGREMTITVTGENLQDVLYAGAGVLFKEWPSYNGSSLTSGVGIDSFIGYIAELDFSHDGNIGAARVKLESPMVYAQRIVQPPQSLEEVTEATKWTECEQVLSNPLGFAYYLMRWHTPALLEMHDLDGADYLSPRRKYLQCQTRTLGAALQVIADYISGNIGSASDGTTVLRANPLYLGQTARDAVDTLLTFQEQDIRAPLEYRRRMYSAFAEVRGGFFAFSGGKPKAFFVGRRWSQGAGSTEMANGTVTAAQGITEAKARIGHFFAEQNAEIQEFSLSIMRNIDVIDPAYMLWSAFTVSSTYDPYGLGFASNRLLATSIEREWEIDGGGIKKRITLKAQGETFGQAGEELPIGAELNQNGWSIGTPVIWQPYISSSMFGGAQSTSVILAHNEDGKFAVCLNYYTASPEWFDLSGSVDNEAVNDFDFDYGSAFFSSGRDASQALGAFTVTIDGTDANIWYFADVLRSTTASLIESLTLSDSTLTTEARIRCSETYPSLVLAGFKDGTGTRYSRSTDGGVTFGSLTRVGSSITDSADNDNVPFGMAVDGQRQLISAPNSTPVYGTYLATTAGGAFSKLASSQDSAYPQPMLAIEPDSTVAYVTSFDVTARSNDFDGADYWAYNAAAPSGGGGVANEWDNFVESADWTYNGISAGGLSGDAPKWTGLNPQGEGVGVDRAGMVFFPIAYPSNTVFYGISFDIKATFSGSAAQLSTAVLGGSLLQRFTPSDVWHHAVFNRANDSLFPATQQSLGIAFSPRTNVTGTMTVWIDNVRLLVGSGAKLWKVAAFPTAPVWTNVSPASNQAPERPYDLAVDRIHTNTLNMVSAVGSDWYASTNEGTAWSTIANNTPYRAFYTAGDAIATGGLLSMGLSLNGGDDIADISGNLSEVWDGIGTIKQVLAL